MLHWAVWHQRKRFFVAVRIFTITHSCQWDGECDNARVPTNLHLDTDLLYLALLLFLDAQEKQVAAACKCVCLSWKSPDNIMVTVTVNVRLTGHVVDFSSSSDSESVILYSTYQLAIWAPMCYVGPQACYHRLLLLLSRSRQVPFAFKLHSFGKTLAVTSSTSCFLISEIVKKNMRRRTGICR